MKEHITLEAPFASECVLDVLDTAEHFGGALTVTVDDGKIYFEFNRDGDNKLFEMEVELFLRDAVDPDNVNDSFLELTTNGDFYKNLCNYWAKHQPVLSPATALSAALQVVTHTYPMRTQEEKDALIDSLFDHYAEEFIGGADA